MLSTITGEFDTCGVDLVCSLIQSDVDGGRHIGYTTYGVKIIRTDGTKFLEIGDISTDRDFVEHFMMKLEGRYVSGLHVLDVLEDSMP